MFGSDGAALDSLHVWEYVKTGAVSNKLSAETIESVSEEIEKNGTYTLPDTIDVSYSDGTIVAESVVWNADDIAAVNTAPPGSYVIRGTVTFSKEITGGNYEGFTQAETTYTLTVKGKEESNLITDADAAGFESGEDFTATNITIPDNENVYGGESSAHWYQAAGGTGSFVYNVLITLEPGWYTFSVVAMGESGDKVTLNILDESYQVLFEGNATELTGWTENKNEWLNPSVTFYLDTETIVKLQGTVEILAGGWGSVDNMQLVSHESYAYTDNGDGTHQLLCGDCGEKLEDAVECTFVASSVTDAAEGQSACVTYTCICGAQENREVPVSIKGMTEEVSLKTGENTTLDAQIEAGSIPEDVTLQESGTYVSSDESVVKVDADGRVTAGEGTAYITYTVKGNVALNGSTEVFTAAQKSIAVKVTAAAEPDPGTGPSDPDKNPGTEPSQPGSGSDKNADNTGDKPKGEDTTPAVSEPSSQDTVQTGDDAVSPMIWIVLMVVCAFTVTVTVVKVRKHRD